MPIIKCLKIDVLQTPNNSVAITQSIIINFLDDLNY